ncbi:single-strand DNA-binding protein [Arcanobacterium wilhelmae]|uniref:Single-strand DNA-binding protein n=1 Tax=Arcanobacterium wilhelmae TaxID=1803177 RepID=A0ABT9N9J9_9ACTO|nr:single-stranded DNA-binding protein [Arcanobacterium wilhelmae]MDP9800383.1 single-strand DNA-binding protein [Arcanobacterium wilhelmae]WFN89814.1 single-stranded DNA-binding protein [Arcanobacterium wilhelmae]
MSNDTIISVRGFAAADPQVYTNAINAESGESFERKCTVFRIGVTPSYYSTQAKDFRNGETAWYTVRTYGALADNVEESVTRGTALMVRGRFTVRQYKDSEGTMRSDNVIIADSVGLDLNSGTGRLVKRRREPLPGVKGEPGAPREESVDEATGEVLEGEVSAQEMGEGPQARTTDVADNLAHV